MRHFSLQKDGGLIEDSVSESLLHSYEKIAANIYRDSSDASDRVAEHIIDAINAHNASGADRPFRLGLTTGASPVSLYKWLTRRYDEGRVSFKNVEIFSIDEYYPISGKAPQSRNHRLHEELLDHIDIPEGNIHLPDGTVPQEDVTAYCAEYEQRVRNLDLLVIGVGEQCQVGFNEPGTSSRSHTRTVLLSYQSRKRQSENFNGKIEDTPREAITIGISTMLSAREVILMAWGESKADAVMHIAEGNVDPMLPATYFQEHDNVSLYVDETAASQLTRVVAPWMVGQCEWTSKFIRKAVVWLCMRVKKPILKLTQRDYLDNFLGDLLEQHGPFDKINIKVFNDLQHTITGWPGGKPDADDSTRPVKSTPFPKTVLIFSPHPDDDVISMGGTFIRLVHQGHDVHVAYETSGDLAVHDDVVLQHLDVARQLGFPNVLDHVKEVIAGKNPGAPEPAELLAIKAAIRRGEARAAVNSFGLDPDTNVHFLNLPFYESGCVQKLPCTQEDIDIIKKLLVDIKPDQVYMAGDLADPHGTHRICTEAAMEAITQLEEEGNPWVSGMDIWLYRGAWMEWEADRVDMAVPLSPDELIEKRHAIFRHLSQKDIVPFPGDDPREFWQRAEERTQSTAHLYDELGMAEYQALEVFLKYK